MLLKNLSFTSRFSEVAIICAVDICRAASRVAPQEGTENEVPLISMALDIAHELKVGRSPYRHRYFDRDAFRVGR